MTDLIVKTISTTIFAILVFSGLIVGLFAAWFILYQFINVLSYILDHYYVGGTCLPFLLTPKLFANS